MLPKSYVVTVFVFYVGGIGRSGGVGGNGSGQQREADKEEEREEGDHGLCEVTDGEVLDKHDEDGWSSDRFIGNGAIEVSLRHDTSGWDR